MTIAIHYPDIGEMHGAGQLEVVSSDIYESDTKEERQEYFRLCGYNVMVRCSHYTFAHIHADTKLELRRAIMEAMEETRKIIVSKLRGGSVDYADRRNRGIVRRFVKGL